jgi:hypothetical protein
MINSYTFDGNEDFDLIVKFNDTRILRSILFEEADIEINKLDDAGLDSSAWRSYRQALRDVTKQITSADSEVIFPEKPQ